MRVAFLAAAAAIVLGSCTNADVIATVDGDAIYEDDILSLRGRYVDGDPDQVAAEAIRQDLTATIYARAFAHALEEDFGVAPPTDAQIQERRDQPPPRWQPVFDQLRAQNTDATDAWFSLVAENSLIRDAAVVALLESPESEADLGDIFTNQPTVVTRTCAAHIVVPTIGEAQAVLDRLDAGEAFEQLANELSLDTGSPGGLLVDPNNPQDCLVSAARFVPEFADALVVAALNEPFGPVQTDFGWHVVLVLERQAPETLTVFESDPLRYLDPGFASSIASRWEDDAVGRADIEVASQLGRWNPATDGILPPDDGATTPPIP
jgi:parvulin-like peptidyl-prolyl isomerase